MTSHPAGSGEPRRHVTELLEAVNAREPEALDRLLSLVYDEMRRMAAARMVRERPGGGHQATELVHEAFFKLFEGERASWHGRAHLFGAAARAMEQVLVEWARRSGRAKRGGGWQRVPIEGLGAEMDRDPLDVLAVSEALARLEDLDSRKAIVVRLRYFGGFTVQEVAEALDVSEGTVKGDWTYARAWLARELSGSGRDPASDPGLTR